VDTEIFRSIILGIVQGITEFFPISSTAHLIILPWLFGWEGEVNTLTFDVALHSGTLLALIIFFFNDWVKIMKERGKLFFFILLATIPAALSGFFFEDLVKNTLRSPLIISISLIVIGIYMYLSEVYGRKANTIDNLSILDALLIGISQAVALIPGVSRSGITISTGLFRGMKREASARFSFLMSTPIICGATVLEGRSLVVDHASHDMGLFFIGILASFLSGIVSIKFLLSFLRRFSLNIFIYYRFLLSGIIISMVWLKG